MGWYIFILFFQIFHKLMPNKKFFTAGLSRSTMVVIPPRYPLLKILPPARILPRPPRISPFLLNRNQCCGAGAEVGAGAARSRSFLLEPEPKKKFSFWHWLRLRLQLRLRQLANKNTYITSTFFSNYDNEFRFLLVIFRSTQGYH